MGLTAKKRPDVPVAFCYKGEATMSRDKLLHCTKNVKDRSLRRIAPMLVAAMLTGCSWVAGDEPPPAEGDGEFPNLASVPERPDPSVFEETSLLQAGLRADRENARYDETPLAASTAAGVPPPPPTAASAPPAAPTAPAAPPPPASTVAAAPIVTAGTPTAIPVPADVAALPPEAMPPAIATPPAVVVTPVEAPVAAAPPVAVVPSVPVTPVPETVASYSVDTPIPPDTGSLPPPPSPVQVFTRSTAVVPEPTALAAVPPSPYGATQPAPYQATQPAPYQATQPAPYQATQAPPVQAVPGQFAPSQAAPGPQVAAINPMALSRNLVAGSALPASVVYFADGSSSVSSAEAAKIYQVAQFLAGRGGYVRVVGHSSMRTGNMDRARQYQANLEVSWARANAVADALLRYGVPASAMMVSAVSDSRPIYLENMPSGEAGNRRVEIYLE
jgi:outer membrane protein OmpA-like peptidoglycan-associated protein